MRRLPLLWCVATLVTSSVCAVPLTAFAKDPARALEYYTKAKQAYGQGDYQSAAELLERAYAEDADLIYQYNRVRALQQMQEYEEALGVISIYKSPMMRDPEKRFTDIESIESELKTSLAQKPAISPSEEPPQERKVVATPPPSDPPPTAPPRTDVVVQEDSGPGMSTGTIVGWSLVGLGGAALAVSAVYGSGLLLSEQPTDSSSQADRTAYNDELDQQRLITTITLASGAVLAGTGLVFLLLADDEEQGVSLLPHLGPEHAGAMVHWQF